MHRQMLSDAIYEKADALYEAHEDMHDAFTLLRVLARIADGESIERAFGAPGDWGYGTAIGKALFHDPAPNYTKLTCRRSSRRLRRELYRRSR